ncbi:MAG: hypothetical protein M1118_04530 [Chloroflexi bacterium]|nr:hypothetical protein [Chloroflexota bacterium]
MKRHRMFSLLASLLLTIGTFFPAADQVQAAGAITGVMQIVPGSSITHDRLVQLSQVAPPSPRNQEAPNQGVFHFPRARAQAALSLPHVGSPPPSSQPTEPVTDTIAGPTNVDSGFVPPDTMGAVGPAQFMFTVNGRFQAFAKNGAHTLILNVPDATFWGNIADPSGVTDPHVRYDRLSGRWFITEIDVPAGDNHILLAVSSGSDLSTASWTKYAISATGTGAAQDQGCFADYDTPGIDANGIYVGANMFPGTGSCTGFVYLHSNVYVVQKSSALSGGPLNVTSFYNVTNGLTGPGPYIPQGVDSVDTLATGYIVGLDIAAFATGSLTDLSVLKVNNPGSTTPTLSGPSTIALADPENQCHTDGLLEWRPQQEQCDFERSYTGPRLRGGPALLRRHS